MNAPFVRRLTRCLLIIGSCWVAGAAEPLVLHLDFDRTNGLIRALHGVNKGPLGPGGLLDLTGEQRALGLPLTRLHDCHWPNPDVVDIHVVFPDFKADPARAENYDFRLTDEYLAAVRATGAPIIYRLGESIEHTRVRRFTHPPTDVDQWAAICLGIIRHYNEGWAEGFHYDIRYWEIWNEPENRPAMWSGTDEDYFQLYRAAAAAIKGRFPDLKVGGPAVGASGAFVDDHFRATEFVAHFLERCRTTSLPLDFFSWHCYTADPGELVRRARAIRRLLDEHGFPQVESHLNEWNYLPGNSWAPLDRNGPAGPRQLYFEAMAGMPGATFIASALIGLQDAPLHAANLFHGEAGSFGLCNEFGVPQKNYFALLAFHDLCQMPCRVEVTGASPGRLDVLSGLNPPRNRAGVLLSNFASAEAEIRLDLEHLPWKGDTLIELRILDDGHNLEAVRSETVGPDHLDFHFHLPKPSVALLQLRPQAGTQGDH